MAQATESKLDNAIAEAAAEKAYASATESVSTAVQVPVKAEAVTAQAPAKPAKIEKAAKAEPAAPAAKAKPAKPAKKVAAVRKAVKAAKPAPKLIKKATPKKAAAKQQTAKVAVKLPLLSKIKDTIMTKTNEDFTVTVKEAVADAQERAKAAFDKGTAAFGELNEFNKGNVEALVESGKILAAGMQDLGKVYVADGKSAIETMTADVKELAAVKSPADFFKLQSEILRRNFDAAVATGSKRSEALVKLANEAYAPISSRVSLAVDKVKQAA